MVLTIVHKFLMSWQRQQKQEIIKLCCEKLLKSLCSCTSCIRNREQRLGKRAKWNWKLWSNVQQTEVSYLMRELEVSRLRATPWVLLFKHQQPETARWGIAADSCHLNGSAELQKKKRSSYFRILWWTALKPLSPFWWNFSSTKMTIPDWIWTSKPIWSHRTRDGNLSFLVKDIVTSRGEVTLSKLYEIETVRVAAIEKQNVKWKNFLMMLNR